MGSLSLQTAQSMEAAQTLQAMDRGQATQVAQGALDAGMNEGLAIGLRQ